MKKIVAAASIAALAATAAFADVKISGNYRLGTELFKSVSSDTKAKDGTSEINNLTKLNWGDNVTFEWSGEKAGIKLLAKTSESSWTMDYGYAWMGFGDSYKLYAGTQDVRGRIARVNPLDGNWWNNYCEYGKPGLHKDSGYAIGIDAASVTGNGAGSKAVNFMNEYAFNEMVTARLSLFKDGNAATDAYGSVIDGLSVAAQADVVLDVAKINATFYYLNGNGEKADGTKVEDKNKMSFGLFVNPIIDSSIQALVGFTYANNEEKDDAALGFDIRLSYKMDALTIYTLNNITKIGDVTMLWDTLGCAYKVNDVLTAVGFQAILNSKSTTAGLTDDENTSDYLAIRPYVDLTAMKNAVLSIGVEYKIDNVMGDGDQTKTLSVPVAFRVKM